MIMKTIYILPLCVKIDKLLKVVHEEKEQQFQISAATILSMR